VISKPLPVLLILMLLASHSRAALAQQSSNDWSSVQRIKVNSKLVIKTISGDDVKGLMIEANDSTLTIDQKGKPRSISRSEIQQVFEVEGKAQKGKWALIGAGVGAGAGTGIGTVKYSPDSDDSEIYIAMGLLIGTGVGAVSGMLFGQSKRKRVLVYSR